MESFLFLFIINKFNTKVKIDSFFLVEQMFLWYSDTVSVIRFFKKGFTITYHANHLLKKTFQPKDIHLCIFHKLLKFVCISRFKCKLIINLCSLRIFFFRVLAIK